MAADDADSSFSEAPSSQCFDASSSDNDAVANPVHGVPEIIGQQAQKEALLPQVNDLEYKVFENQLFEMVEVVRESLATVLILKCHNDDHCPLHFRLIARGLW